MPWLVTHNGDALNLEKIDRLYAERGKVKALMHQIPVNVAVNLTADAADRVLRAVVAEIALGHSVEVVGEEVRRLTDLR